MSYHIELFHSLMNEFPQGEAALITTDGDVLAVRGKNPVTYGTLTTACLTTGKYLPLQEGDIAVLNDPYSGGSTLDEITFIMAVSEDLFWISRRGLGKSLKSGKSIEDEGLRIPPTPVLQKGQMNKMILSAMQAHPACPPRFAEWIEEQCQDLTAQAKKFVDTIENTGFVITSELIEEYLELSKNFAQAKISENVSGETRVDIVLDSGELLRLHLEIQDGRVLMDFSGTSAAKTLNLTEAATFATCFHTISNHYKFTSYANTGSFGILQVTKPSGCWLMAKYPASTFKGMTSGVAALQAAIELALSHIQPKKEKALNSYAPLLVQFQYQNRSAYLQLSGGCGATQHRDGKASNISSVSIECLERDLPIRIHRVDLRQSLGGKGKFAGGRGLILKLEALDDLQVQWSTDLTMHRPRLPKNCSAGDTCEVSLERDAQSKVLPVFGQEALKKGDLLTLCSGSGGGWGRAEVV